MEISFYQLLKTPLDKALPKILEKAYEAGFRCLVVCESPERRDVLDTSLWTYSPTAFLPHGCKGDAVRHPIWLSVTSANENHANLIVVTNGIAPENLSEFTRCLDLFDGNDSVSLESARNRYKNYANAGHSLTFWQQTDQGAWVKAS